MIVREGSHHLRVTSGVNVTRERRAGRRIVVAKGTSPLHGGPPMRTIMIFCEVDDVGRWLASPKRREVFGPLGITARTFVDAATSNRVGLIVEVASMELFEEAMDSPAAAEAMTYDGVRPDTMRVFIEG